MRREGQLVAEYWLLGKVMRRQRLALVVAALSALLSAGWWMGTLPSAWSILPAAVLVSQVFLAETVARSYRRNRQAREHARGILQDLNGRGRGGGRGRSANAGPTTPNLRREFE
jgi:hypothetical protein